MYEENASCAGARPSEKSPDDKTTLLRMYDKNSAVFIYPQFINNGYAEEEPSTNLSLNFTALNAQFILDIQFCIGGA